MGAIDSVKETLEKAKLAAGDAGRHAKDAAEDLKDKASASLHAAGADAEAAERKSRGDSMTAGEKLESVANEAVDRTEAAVDRTKVSLRSER